MKDPKQRIEDAFNSLMESGLVHNKTEFAAFVEQNYSNVVSALNGNPKYANKTFAERIEFEIYRKTGMSQSGDEAEKIPLIPITAWGGSLDNFDGSAELAKCEMVTSPIAGATFAIQVAGDSMAPDYPAGSQVIVKRINEKAFIEWGKVYVLDTENGAIIKEIRKSEEDGCVCCHSINENGKYLPFDVAMKSIRGFYRVLMVMSLK